MIAKTNVSKGFSFYFSVTCKSFYLCFIEHPSLKIGNVSLLDNLFLFQNFKWFQICRISVDLQFISNNQVVQLKLGLHISSSAKIFLEFSCEFIEILRDFFKYTSELLVTIRFSETSLKFYKQKYNAVFYIHKFEI